ncbi:MAG: LPS export ABC transporter permease LptG [Pseudomonadota bacterium]
MSLTLFSYLASRFLGMLGGTLTIVLALVFLIDLVEQLRRASDSAAGLTQVLSLVVLHSLPVASVTFPFVFMLAAMACFARLARSSELVVTRAAGLSAWRVLAPALICAVVLGLLAVTVINPISAAMLQRFETLEARYLRGQESLLSISREGLWLRQASGDGQTVIRALRADPSGGRLYDVTFFDFSRQNALTGRIEAREAALREGGWQLTDAQRWQFDRTATAQPPRRERHQRYTVPTDLTRDRILESFASPDAIGFWDLPEFIATLRASGFSALRHEMHYQKELAKPLLFAAMVLLGAAFSMRHVRFGGIGMMLMGATLTGFGLFFISDITQALGASGAIPTLIAAWVPPSAAALLATGLILHMEDG